MKLWHSDDLHICTLAARDLIEVWRACKISFFLCSLLSHYLSIDRFSFLRSLLFLMFYCILTQVTVINQFGLSYYAKFCGKIQYKCRSWLDSFISLQLVSFITKKSSASWKFRIKIGESVKLSWKLCKSHQNEESWPSWRVAFHRAFCGLGKDA